jgi:hypothetical protein
MIARHYVEVPPITVGSQILSHWPAILDLGVVAAKPASALDTFSVQVWNQDAVVVAGAGESDLPCFKIGNTS